MSPLLVTLVLLSLGSGQAEASEACQEKFSDCREDCSMAFGTNLGARDKLNSCLGKCFQSRGTCGEKGRDLANSGIELDEPSPEPSPGRRSRPSEEPPPGSVESLPAEPAGSVRTQYSDDDFRDDRPGRKGSRSEPKADGKGRPPKVRQPDPEEDEAPPPPRKVPRSQDEDVPAKKPKTEPEEQKPSRPRTSANDDPWKDEAPERAPKGAEPGPDREPERSEPVAAEPPPAAKKPPPPKPVESKPPPPKQKDISEWDPDS